MCLQIASIYAVVRCVLLCLFVCVESCVHNSIRPRDILRCNIMQLFGFQSNGVFMSGSNRQYILSHGHRQFIQVNFTIDLEKLCARPGCNRADTQIYESLETCGKKRNEIRSLFIDPGSSGTKHSPGILLFIFKFSISLVQRFVHKLL